MNYVLISEETTLSSNQILKLNEKFGEGKWERWNIPTEGWNATQQRYVATDIICALTYHDSVVFTSPMLLLMKLLIEAQIKTLVFHNNGNDDWEIVE